MLAVVRLVFSLFNKERAIFSNYNRSHPHFKWYLGLDALLSMALVVGGFDYAFSTSSGPSTLSFERSGAIAMSSSELVKVVQDGHFTGYWLGPMPEYKYTLVSTRKGEIIISYLPRASDIANLKQAKLTVETYLNSTGVKSPICSTGQVAISKSTASCVSAVKFNKDSMAEETVSIKGTTMAITIHYPMAQTLATLEKNAQLLRPIM